MFSIDVKFTVPQALITVTGISLSNVQVADKMVRLADKTTRYLHRITPRSKTGKTHLANYWRNDRKYREGTLKKILLANTAPYAKDLLIWLESGTRPHLIPGNPFLAFYWPKKGKDMVLRHVHHPWTKPRRIIERGTKVMVDGLDSIAKTLATEAEKALLGEK